MRFLVNYSLLSEGSFISIFVVKVDSFFRVSLLVCCVLCLSVCAGVPVRDAAAWLHCTGGVPSRLAHHQYYKVASAQNRRASSSMGFSIASSKALVWSETFTVSLSRTSLATPRSSSVISWLSSVLSGAYFPKIIITHLLCTVTQKYKLLLLSL